MKMLIEAGKGMGMKKVFIWGTDKIARELVNYGVNAKIEGMVESYKKREQCMGFPVYDGENIPDRREFFPF